MAIERRSEPTIERRKVRVRRDINDLVRGPDGKVAESKVMVLLFKSAGLYVFVTEASVILKDWMILLIFVLTYVAPDLLKKLMRVRLEGLTQGSSTPTERK